MGMKARTLFFVVFALGTGGYLLWRALDNGNPLYYFLSAVSIGMAIAAGQRLMGKSGPKD